MTLTSLQIQSLLDKKHPVGGWWVVTIWRHLSQLCVECNSLLGMLHHNVHTRDSYVATVGTHTNLWTLDQTNTTRAKLRARQPSEFASREPGERQHQPPPQDRSSARATFTTNQRRSTTGRLPIGRAPGAGLCPVLS